MRICVHAFQTVKVAPDNSFGRRNMFKEVAYYKDKRFGEWITMKDHAKDAEYLQAAQQAKA